MAKARKAGIALRVAVSVADGVASDMVAGDMTLEEKLR